MLSPNLHEPNAIFTLTTRAPTFHSRKNVNWNAQGHNSGHGALLLFFSVAQVMLRCGFVIFGQMLNVDPVSPGVLRGFSSVAERKPCTRVQGLAKKITLGLKPTISTRFGSLHWMVWQYLFPLFYMKFLNNTKQMVR